MKSHDAAAALLFARESSHGTLSFIYVFAAGGVAPTENLREIDIVLCSERVDSVCLPSASAITRIGDVEVAMYLFERHIVEDDRIMFRGQPTITVSEAVLRGQHLERLTSGPHETPHVEPFLDLRNSYGLRLETRENGVIPIGVHLFRAATLDGVFITIDTGKRQSEPMRGFPKLSPIIVLEEESTILKYSKFAESVDGVWTYLFSLPREADVAKFNLTRMEIHGSELRISLDSVLS